MSDEALLTEQQRFKQIWLWIILFVVNIPLLIRIFRRVIKNQSFTAQHTSSSEFLTAGCLGLIVIVLFLFVRMDTVLKKDGIYVRFFPFHQNYRKYLWKEIAKVSVREYNPIRDFGGWGMREELFGKGKAYNVAGNKGIQLVFKDGSTLLIGTNKVNEVKELLAKMDLN